MLAKPNEKKSAIFRGTKQNSKCLQYMIHNNQDTVENNQHRKKQKGIERNKRSSRGNAIRD